MFTKYLFIQTRWRQQPAASIARALAHGRRPPPQPPQPRPSQQQQQQRTVLSTIARREDAASASMVPTRARERTKHEKQTNKAWTQGTCAHTHIQERHGITAASDERAHGALRLAGAPTYIDACACVCTEGMAVCDLRLAVYNYIIFNNNNKKRTVHKCGANRGTWNASTKQRRHHKTPPPHPNALHTSIRTTGFTHLLTYGPSIVQLRLGGFLGLAKRRSMLRWRSYPFKMNFEHHC